MLWLHHPRGVQLPDSNNRSTNSFWSCTSHVELRRGYFLSTMVSTANVTMPAISSSTTSCHSLTNSDLARLHMKAHSQLHPVVRVRLAEACYWNGANLAPFHWNGLEKIVSGWSVAAATPTRGLAMSSWMWAAVHKLFTDDKLAEIFQHTASKLALRATPGQRAHFTTSQIYSRQLKDILHQWYKEWPRYSLLLLTAKEHTQAKQKALRVSPEALQNFSSLQSVSIWSCLCWSPPTTPQTVSRHFNILPVAATATEATEIFSVGRWNIFCFPPLFQWELAAWSHFAV